MAGRPTFTASSLVAFMALLALLATVASALDISRMSGHQRFVKRAAGEDRERENAAYLLSLLSAPYAPRKRSVGGWNDWPASPEYSMYSAYGYRPSYSGPKDEILCKPYEPFRCPNSNKCISIQYLCDGAPDCEDGYDENAQLCTAAKRPPVDETAAFLSSLLSSHGPNYLEKLFGKKARNALQPLGGVEKVAVALSESQTIDEFGRSLKLMREDVDHLRSVFMAVENGDIGMLKSLGIKDSELGDVKFFLEKLVHTGFLD